MLLLCIPDSNIEIIDAMYQRHQSISGISSEDLNVASSNWLCILVSQSMISFSDI